MIEEVKKIILDWFTEDVKIILYGSRARGDYYPSSDIDIGILYKDKSIKNKIILLRDKLEESNIPYKVDIVDLSESTEEFVDKVLKEGIIWKDFQ